MKHHILFVFPKLGKMSQNLSSAAVVIRALRINYAHMSSAFNVNVCYILPTKKRR